MKTRFTLISISLAVVAIFSLSAQQPTTVLVPNGSFTMGCTVGQAPCGIDEAAHLVVLDSFYIGEHEVTQMQYESVMGINPSGNAGCDDCPVENVTWYDAVRYCNLLSQQAGLTPCYYADDQFSAVFDGTNGTVWWWTEADGFRLPTEAEWEYAARSAGADDFAYAGSNDPNAVAWLPANSGQTTQPVGSLSPNALGLFDMSGNVAEWVWDRFGTFTADDACYPLGASAGNSRILRGGDVENTGDNKLARRSSTDPSAQSARNGFRVCSYQYTSQLPDCVTMLTQPLNNATDVALSTSIEWEAAANAMGYRISLGTSPNGTNLINNEDLGNSLSYNYPGCLPSNTIIYVTIIAYGINGDATGCGGFRFTTEGGLSGMVVVPGGTIDLGGQSATSPVTIDSFLIGRYEVTQSVWECMMGTWVYGFSACGADCPVERVRWYDVVTFCNRLSLQHGLEPVYYFDADFTEVFDSLGTGLNSYVDIFWKQSSDGYRLPTEAEWEYAARGATNSPNYLYAGSNDVDEVGWYAVNNLPFGIKSVGQKLPNSLGLYDMSGNVSEWCWDWEGGLFPGSPNNPSGPSGGTSRIFRGGNFGSPATLLEVSSQDFNVPGFRFNYLGFRIARGAIDQALDCVTTLVQPLDNATDVALSTNIAWEAAANATGYRISLGTSPNGTNLVNNEDLGTSLSYNAPGCLPSNTIIYVTIIAYDANGDATGCSGFSFRTRTDATPDMVTIAGGTFQMGCTSEQSDCDNDETPVHSVTLDGFLIGRFEVTQCEWEDVMGNWTFGFSNCGGSCPAEQINYYDVATFCNRLSEQEGLEPVYYIDSNFDTPFDSIVQIPVFPEIEIFWKPGAKGYRMPTEAEWEYAARGLGAAPQTLYSGSNVADEVGWYDANAGSEVHPVGQKQSNAAGLYDMSGNVWERCWDVYDLTYYNSSPINNPTGPANTGQDLWVGRGSSWFNEEEHWLRVANREHFSKITRINSVGFRICRTP